MCSHGRDHCGLLRQKCRVPKDGDRRRCAGSIDERKKTAARGGDRIRYPSRLGGLSANAQQDLFVGSGAGRNRRIKKAKVEIAFRGFECSPVLPDRDAVYVGIGKNRGKRLFPGVCDGKDPAWDLPEREAGNREDRSAQGQLQDPRAPTRARRDTSPCGNNFHNHCNSYNHTKSVTGRISNEAARNRAHESEKTTGKSTRRTVSWQPQFRQRSRRGKTRPISAPDGQICFTNRLQASRIFESLDRVKYL